MIDWAKERADLESDYRKVFGKDTPELVGEFSDEQICDFLIECLQWRKIPNAREMDEHDWLALQYRIKFPNAGEIPLMITHMTEEEWRQAISECLKSGKPYELPEDVQQLIEQGAQF